MQIDDRLCVFAMAKESAVWSTAPLTFECRHVHERNDNEQFAHSALTPSIVLHKTLHQFGKAGRHVERKDGCWFQNRHML